MDSIISLATAAFGVGAGGGIGFLIVKWVFEFVGGRMDKRADRLDAGTDKLFERMQAEIDRLVVRVDGLEIELKECKAMHAEEAAKRVRLEAIMQGRGELRDRAASIVAAERLADRPKTEKKG